MSEVTEEYDPAEDYEDPRTYDLTASDWRLF